MREEKKTNIHYKNLTSLVTVTEKLDIVYRLRQYFALTFRMLEVFPSSGETAERGEAILVCPLERASLSRVN